MKRSKKNKIIVSDTSHTEMIRELLNKYQAKLIDPIIGRNISFESMIKDTDKVWILGFVENELVGLFSILVDNEQGLARFNHILGPENFEHHRELLADMFLFTFKELGKRTPSIDVLYAITINLIPEQQDLMKSIGFKTLGIFPNSIRNQSKIVGIMAYYDENVLRTKRFNDFQIHPKVKPFYSLVKHECILPDLPEATSIPKNQKDFKKTLPLELIDAPLFVQKKFHNLKERRMLSVNFYPFQEPNAIATDPDQQVEIFLHMVPEFFYSTIIGERIDQYVNPVELFKSLSDLLATKGIVNLEVLLDASDLFGIESLIEAGFYPCMYFPCLKKQGDFRRDYVILAKSDRYFSFKNFVVNPIHLEYLRLFTNLVREQEDAKPSLN